MIRILLADDHDVVRRGLRDMIVQQPGWEVCGEARDGLEAVELATALKPEVAIVDMAMPMLDGLAVTREIRVRSPTTEILVFTMYESEDLVAAVLAVGGRGCLLKSAAVRSIIPAIATVAAHRPYFPDASEAQAEVFRRASGNAEAPSLFSPREREVVELLVRGLDRRSIAECLGLSERTVRAHHDSAMAKIGGRTLADLVRYAIRNGIIEP